MDPKVAFVTNATEYVGAPAATTLAEAGWHVFCHDDSFAKLDARVDFERKNLGCVAAHAQTAVAFVAEGVKRFGRIDALISNDIPKGIATLDALAVGDENDLFQDFEAYLDSLVTEPIRVLRAALPTMKTARSGSVVLIASGAPLRVPWMGGPHGYSAGRAAANMLAKSLSAELSGYNIQVNAVAPFLVYSQTFFPSEIGPDDPKYALLITKMVPMGRFGAANEIGNLIAHLASGDMSFVSGQVIAFSGGGC